MKLELSLSVYLINVTSLVLMNITVGRRHVGCSLLRKMCFDNVVVLLSQMLTFCRDAMEPASRCGNGKFPEFGAIFMSNTKTRQECFSRSLFALPLNFTEFVRKVRAGMVLFLFDYQERKLYGVFEAVTDGGLNYEPHAYNSSGRSFPAQVRFRITWKCHPLCAHEFRHAIRENYYTEFKFNFGLSEEQVRRLLYMFDSRRFDVTKSLSEAKIKDTDSANLGRKRIKRRHFDDLDDQKSSSKPDVPGNAENCSLLINRSSEVESCLVDPSGLEKSPSSNSPKDIKPSSSAPFELEDFIPLDSPEHCSPNEIMATNDHGSSGLYGAQSPCYSKDEDLPEHHLRVKGLYSDRTKETKSVFSRLGESKTVNNGNLLHRQNVESKTHIVRQRRKIPIVANVFSRLKFNSESNEQEKEVSQEKEMRRGRGGCNKNYGRAEKNYSTIPRELFDNTERIILCRGMQEEQPFMSSKPEDKTDKVIEDERDNHSPVSSILSDMQQKKKELVWPDLRAESKNVDVCKSFLDDQVEACENSTVEAKPESLQLTLRDIPSKLDAMQYLEHVSEHNQGQQKCAEKDASLSFCASKLIEMIDNHKRCLENMATTVTCLVAEHDNSDDKVKNMEGKLENLSNMS